MQTYTIRYSIKDADGQHEYDYSDDFLVDLDETPAGINNEFEQNLLSAFKRKVKDAVTEWFNTDKDTVIGEIDQYGHEYDFENEAYEGQPELEYAISMFPARCVAHIPNEIMEHHGFRNAPSPSAEYESYDDLGFLDD